MNEYDTKTLIKRYPALKECENDIECAFHLISNCFENGGKLLIAGNGGSSADADHIAGELMKSFKRDRPIDKKLTRKLNELGREDIAMRLQQGLPTIVLHHHHALNTAFINDVDNGANYLFAQQLFVYGNKSDVFLAISTSGNAQNIINAVIVAKAKDMKVIGLTGEDGGKLSEIADVTIKAPAKETFMVQEYHLPIYHCLCLMLENYFFQK